MIPSELGDGFDAVREIAAVRPALTAYVASILPQARHETDDVVQETCLMLWEKRDKFQAGTNFKAWAFRTAYFKGLAMRRDLTAIHGLSEPTAPAPRARAHSARRRRFPAPRLPPGGSRA